MANWLNKYNKAQDGVDPVIKNKYATPWPAPQSVRQTTDEDQAHYDKIRNARLEVNQMPLHYLANPSHIVGDFVNEVQTLAGQPSEGRSNIFGTSKEDAKKYAMANSNYEDRLNAGLDLVPSAALNVGLGMAGAEGKGALSVMNEMFNPVAGGRQFLNNLGEAGYSSIGDRLIRLNESKMAANEVRKDLADPETIRRAEALGLDTDKFKMATDNLSISTNPNTSSSFGGAMEMNINPNDVGSDRLAKITANEIGAHETGHLFQMRELWNEDYPLALPRLNSSLMHGMKDVNPHGYKQMKQMFENYSTTPTAPTKLDELLGGLTSRNPQTFGKNGDKALRYFRNAHDSYGTKVDNMVERLPMFREYRQGMRDSGVLKNKWDEITPEHINEYYNLNPDNRLNSFMAPTKENGEILRRASQIAPAIGVGTVLTKDNWLDDMQDGGVVKDDNGYWNPDNHGKVVEIGSNNITMKGVDQPLIGVSDTGDIQYMQPGEDYKFKGNKVTEFPIAQGGINFDDIPTNDNKKIVIDNYSKNFDYIIEGDKTYSKPKKGNNWTDISDNKRARNNLSSFLDKNNYWAGYGSKEKESYYESLNPTPVTPAPVTPVKEAPQKLTDWIDNLPEKQELPTEQRDLVAPEGDMEQGIFSELFETAKSLGSGIKQGLVDDYEWVEDTVLDVLGTVGGDNVKNALADSNSVSDLLEIATNGVKRKWALKTGDTDDVEVTTPTPDKIPKTVSEYYGDETKGRVYNTIDAPKTDGRVYKQQYLPLNNIKFGARNRGDYTEFETDGMEVTTFNPFVDKQFPDNTTVIALDPEGNVHAGVAKDFRDKEGWTFSNTYRNNISSFPEVNGKSKFKPSVKNPGFQQPVVSIIGDDGKKTQGSLNLLIKNSNGKFYGSVQGGRVMFQDPNTGEVHLVSGNLDHIKSEFNRIKGDSPYLVSYSLDNGTYSRGLSYKDKKMTADRLKAYDKENAGGGGNGLFIKEYKQPVHNFTENYVNDMPNVRTEKDNSYKKGHALKNKVKNVVLHHTAYTEEDTNESEVKKQFMTPNNASAHVVIEEDGTRNVYASPEQVTFHAGKSEWDDGEDVNDYAVGVEFQGDTTNKPLTEAQIESFVEYYRPIAKKYNLSLKDIMTHEMTRIRYMNKNPNDKNVKSKPDVSVKTYQRIMDHLRKNNFK